MATKPENVNPFAKYVEQSGEVAQENPFAKFVTPSLDVEQLKAETEKYEKEVPFFQRITDPLKQGIASLSGMLPGLEVSSIQKEIEAIREGKRGPRDPLTGEQLPFQPEEQENAIKILQDQQKEAQAKVMSAQAESGKFQTRPAVAALSNVDSAREAFQAFQVDPLGVMSSVSLQSLPQIVPALILGAVTRNPTVGALAMGSTSFAGELSSGVSEYFQEQGVNIKDPIEVNKALNDPAMFTKAYEYALTRGSIIGVADTAAAGLASKLLVPKDLIKNQFAKEAANIGVAQPVAQMLSGAGGEAAAQLATEGEVTKPGQVLLEAAGEGPSSVLETAAFGGKEALNRLKTTPTEAVPPEPSAVPTPAVPAAAVPSAIITEEDIDTGEGLTPVSPTPTPVTPEEPAAVAPVAVEPTPPTPTPPAAPTAEIAQRIDELEAEFKAIDASYATATPDQIGPLSARQGEIKSEIARLFQAGTTGAPVAPVEAVAPVPTEVTPAAPVQVPEAAAPVEVPATPKEEFSMKALQFQNRFIDAEKSGKLTKAQSNIIFNLYNNNKVEEAEKRLNNILRRQEKLAAAAKTEEVVTAAPVEAPEPAEVAMSKNKRLTDFLSQDKNELIERFAKNNNISPEYAEKVYNAEKEYLENFARYGYGPNPDPDHESKFIAAQKKYDAFQNKLKGVSSRANKKIPDNFTEYDIIDALENVRNGRYFGEPQKVKNLYSEELYDEAIAKGLIEEKAYNKFIFTEEGNKGSERWLATEEAPKKKEKPEPGAKAVPVEVKKTQAEINKERQTKKKNKEEHIEGKKSEPVTSKTIEDAIDKAEVTVDSGKIKTAIKNQFEQAIKRAKIKTEQEWSEAKGLLPAEKFVTISVPGDGQFKVKNNVERLKELQTKMVNATTLKGPTVKGGPSSGAIEAFKGMVDDKDMENAIEYAKLKGLDPKTVKLTPAQRTTVDNYLKNPAEFERQQEDQTEYYRKQAIASREANDKLIRERNEAYEKRDEEARFDAVLKTTIRSTQPQLKGDIAKRKITSMDAARMLEVIPGLPTGTVKPYVTKELKKIAEPKAGVVTDDEGEKLDFPLVVDMANKGYKVLGFDNPRTYENKGGVKYRTIEKDGVRLAFEANQILFSDPKYPNRPPQLGYGNPNQLTWHFIGVDKDQRKQGKATQAIKDFMDVADKNGYTVYGEPAQLEKEGMTAKELSNFYSKFGFKPSEVSDKVIIREPGAKAAKPLDKPYYNDFTSNIDYNELYKRAEVSREDRIKEYAQTRAASRRALKKIAKYGSDIPMQRELNELLNKEEMLKVAVSINKPKRNTAADFIARATQEMANENLAPEVEAVIRQVYEKYPGILEGLRLSLRTRQAGGRDAGNFNPYNRIVTLWKDSSGVDNPSTIRHELTHSLEQMMTPEARQAVVEAWARSFETAIKRNTDKKSQEFFNKVFDFLDNPSKQSFDAATKVMPSYDFYQYMNPSEYWAVNAEKLMEAKLGTPWARFVSAVKKILEALKSVFGVNNTFTVHKEFDNIINGKLERKKGEDMLVDYLLQGKVKIDFLNNIEDVNDLLDKHSRPDAPRKPSMSVRDTFMGGYENTKETVKDVLTSPLIATNNMIGKADRALTYFRNKNIFFGYGLEEADRQRYGGQIRNAHQQAIASVAVVNALHSGNIATQVMTLGKLEFDPDIQMFVAKKSDKNMANVVREKAKLIDKLGFDTGNRVIQSYFEAKRSRSIVNEYLNREAAYEAAIESGQKEEEARKDLANIEAAVKKVNMDDEAMADFIALEDKYPELRNMMDNWTAVNQNMIDMMEFSGIISKQRAKSLRSIKDYVPWYRIMDDQEDIHSAPKGTRGLTNVAADKKFGPGKTDRDIDDIVDNMIHNVLTITRNSARNYAANRIVMEYGERYKEGKNAGKLRVFPKDGSDADGVRFNIIANGRRIVVRIQDPLVAESVIGMENLDIPMNGALAFMANTLRRSITTFPAFQVAQLFMDAPTAALVTGLKRPDKVWAGVFSSFLKNVRNDDPIVAKLRAAGIGGYQSSARTPEKEIQLDIGLIQGSWFSKAMKGLDRFGDASDYAQRRSVYLQTMKETGDEMLALFQANNIIDFKKRGSGQIAQLLTRQVAFMNAYAQAIDVLAKGLSGTGLKGIERKKALARMATAGMLLASATLVYSFLVGDDEEYNKLDDQTKMRNIFIPGLNIRLPMHSGAAFFFKAIPELIYNAITKEGTKDEYDRKRLTRALSKAAADALLGPNVTPTGVKPVVEIALNRNFFTGGQVTPRGMEDLAAFRQYNQNTSELGKIISALTGTEKTRLLNPIEADHLVRGLTGTVGAAVMWGTNLLAGDRPTPQARENPLYGQFIMPDLPRGREDLYYDLKSKTDEAYKTYMDLQKKQRKEEAADWFKENKKLIQVYGYTSSIEADLKRLNGEIRRLSDLPKEKMSPDAKRKRMTELQEIKGRMLKDVISMRKRAGFDD